MDFTMPIMAFGSGFRKFIDRFIVFKFKRHFNSLGHIMAVGDAHVFLGSLPPVQTQLSFQSHWLLFSHASDMWSKSMPERKFCLNRVLKSQPPGHKSDMGGGRGKKAMKVQALKFCVI